MLPLSQLWKGLENVRNGFYDAVKVPLQTFVTLTQQAKLLLGQASLSVSYTCHLNIIAERSR